MFYVGQKVCCVNYPVRAVEQWRRKYPDANFPILGQVYTIRAIDVWFGETLLRFVEVNNAHLPSDMEAGFSARHFRPLVERKTDISIFEAMLNPSDEQVSA